MQIYHHVYICIIKEHKTCCARSPSISPKSSSHGLINNYEKFELLNHTHFHTKLFCVTIHMNSETLGLLFTANHQTSVPLCEPENHGHFRPHTHQNMIYCINQYPRCPNSPYTTTDYTKRAPKILTFWFQDLGPIKRPFKALNQPNHQQSS